MLRQLGWYRGNVHNSLSSLYQGWEAFCILFKGISVNLDADKKDYW